MSDGTDELAIAPPQAAENEPRPRKQQFKRDKRDVHGWLVLDKPVGMTSTHAVSVVKRLFSAKRAGHAGTLDPLASGALPIALGEATKTVPFVMDGRKIYRVHRALGRRTRHRRRRGPRHCHQRASARRRRRSARCCPPTSAAIQQVPPRYSAIKIEGERAYDLARDGETVELERPPGRDPPPGARRQSRPRPRRSARRMRQGHLCPVAGPRYWPRFGLFSAMSARCAGWRSAHSARKP